MNLFLYFQLGHWVDVHFAITHRLLHDYILNAIHYVGHTAFWGLFGILELLIYFRISSKHNSKPIGIDTKSLKINMPWSN